MRENRKLMPFEQAMENLNALASCFNIVTISLIKGSLSEEVLRQTLDIIQSRHPLLNSRIVRKSNSFWFEDGADKIPLSVVKKQEIKQWEEVVIQELNQKIDSEKNLLRITLINFDKEENICYLISTIHHAIADAASFIQLQSEILTNCQKIAEGKTEINVTPLPKLPSIYKLMPKSFQGFTGKISNILYLLRLKIQSSQYKAITLNFEKSVPIESRSCDIIYRKLDSELTTELVKICRQQKTTVQGALGAAMLFAVAKKTSNFQTQDIYLSFQSSVNLRSAARLRRTGLLQKISNEHLGLMASVIPTFHHLKKNESFWDLAQDIKQKLETGITRGDAFRNILVSEKIIAYLLKNPYKSMNTAGLTNIGRINIPHDYGQFQLEEISFILSQAAFGGMFAAAVSTFRGKMLLNFMFSQPSISRSTVETLADDTISIITNFCS
ncbi:MAG: condensation domain-containing protein [Cyanobacteria bacterium P01_D01_bin.50]